MQVHILMLTHTVSPASSPLEVGKLYQNTHGDLIVCLSHPIEKPIRTWPAGSQIVLSLALSKAFWVYPDTRQGYQEGR